MKLYESSFAIYLSSRSSRRIFTYNHLLPYTGIHWTGSSYSELYGETSEAGTAYPSGAPAFTPGF